MLTFFAVQLLAACTDSPPDEASRELTVGDEATSASSVRETEPRLDAGGDASPDDEKGKPLYALMSMILGDVTLAYVSLLDSLDAQKIELDAAREFAGWASIAPFQGKLLVADGEAPTITRFAISQDGQWQEDSTVSSSRFGASSVSFFHNVFFDSEVAPVGRDVAHLVEPLRPHRRRRDRRP